MGESKTSSKQFGELLEERTLNFAIEIVKLSGKLPNTPEGLVVRNQITKSGTSVGANYRESNRARSKADFRNKIKICESEASETKYWLAIILKLKWVDNNILDSICKESSELLALFTSIAKNSGK